jgi:hypothetical protein
MTIAKHMESLFLVALALTGTVLGATEVAQASSGNELVLARPASLPMQLAIGQMQVVVITGKRMSAREKADYDAQELRERMHASN